MNETKQGNVKPHQAAALIDPEAVLLVACVGGLQGQ